MSWSKNSQPQNLHAVHPQISITCLNHDCQDFVTMSCFPLRGDMKEMAWLLQQDEELQAIIDQFSWSWFSYMWYNGNLLNYSEIFVCAFYITKCRLCSAMPSWEVNSTGRIISGFYLILNFARVFSLSRAVSFMLFIQWQMEDELAITCPRL